MQMLSLIEKKRDGGALSASELEWMIRRYCAGEIPDYQMSALLMAAYFRGMTKRETLDLTMAMLESGEQLDLSPISGVKGDKHSTGGVGDKTSLVLCPMVASLGLRMAKMSGRGLGFTGGTLDKLESIPGFRSDLSLRAFYDNVERVGMAICAQTEGIDPADKKLYALRDVTGTVAVRGLIVSSIMSKKLAAGADAIVLDVKAGSGSFCGTQEEAEALAKEMVEVGQGAGRSMAAIVTDMEEPLGNAVGNALEVREAVSALRGEKHGELTQLCLTLGARLLKAAGLYDSEDSARAALQESIDSGKALCKLADCIEAQGGDPRVIEKNDLLPVAPVRRLLLAEEYGYVNSIKADGIGRVCTALGGGRLEKDDALDLSVGIVLHKKVGDPVSPGEPIAEIHASAEEKAEQALRAVRACYGFSEREPERNPFIRSVVC